MSQDAANVLEFNLDDVFVGASSGDSDWFPDDESGSETYDESVCETDASGCETEASRFSDEEECQIKEVQEVILPNMEEPKMTPGTKYNSVEEFRLALRQYCVVKEVEVKIVKSGPSRVTAVCADDSCKWRIHASRLRDGMTFQVKTLNDGHSCSSVNKRGNKLAGHRWIASKILSWLKNDPHLTIHTISTRLSEKYHLSLPYHRIWRARELASEQIYGSWDEQYEMVPHFLAEIQRLNLGSTVAYDVDDQNRFLRMFICLSACKKGFLEGCRPILGVDGCHLKSRFRGICLSAVGVDGNYNMFHVAYSIVESETASSWKWFVGNLKQALNLENIVFTSDRNKGLEDAVASVWPTAEHRTCVRHLYANLKKKFSGDFMKGLLWNAANAYTNIAFQAAMRVIQRESQAAYDWLNEVERRDKVWSRSMFMVDAKCHYNTNNISEAFNNYIRHERWKPAVVMMDSIRQKLMQHLYRRRLDAERWEDELTPYARDHLKKVSRGNGKYYVRKASDHHGEVSDANSRFVVNLEDQTCTCRQWQVTGLPCLHAASFIGTIRGVRWEDYVSDYYTVARYKLAYGNSINPMTEKDEWEKVDVNKVKPPLVNRQLGRPQNARRKGKNEAGGPSRAKRVHVCKNCGVHGHRASTCTVPGEDVATTCSDPIRPRGRPKNTNTVTRARNPTNRMVLLSDGTTIGEPSRRAIPDVLRDTPDIVTQESRNSILTYVRRRRKAT